jgi:hypothetical protein
MEDYKRNEGLLREQLEQLRQRRGELKEELQATRGALRRKVHTHTNLRPP